MVLRINFVQQLVLLETQVLQLSLQLLLVHLQVLHCPL